MIHPYNPTPHEVLPELLASLQPGDHMCDLGSGDGRVLRAATLRGAIAVGFEIDEEVARKSAKLHAEVEGLSIRCCDFMDQDWSPFNFLFANIDINYKQLLYDKFEKEGRKGARLLIYTVGELVHG